LRPWPSSPGRGEVEIGGEPVSSKACRFRTREFQIFSELISDNVKEASDAE
jgi:hypothetical protein